MALFIAGLALQGAGLDHAKIGILSASLVAALVSTTTLALITPRRNQERA
jgi:Na+/H+ antiporter NhaA